MANSICIIGESGSGKSTSLGNIEELGIIGLNPEETAILNVMGKPLPFKGSNKLYKDIGLKSGGNYAANSDGDSLLEMLQLLNTRMDIKNIVVDDFQYIMSNEFMEKANNPGFEKFNQIAKHAYDIISYGMDMRPDINFICLTHSEFSEKTNSYKFKTIGKMLDDKITLEGLFTVILYTHVEYDKKEKQAKYTFVTNKYSNKAGVEIPGKSPVGMFGDLQIPNDLGLVIKATEEYYG